MLNIVRRAVCAVDGDDEINQLVLDLLPKRVLVLTRELLGCAYRAQQDVVGLLVNRQMLVLRQLTPRLAFFGGRAARGSLKN